MSLDDTYIKSEEGKHKFENILVLNTLNAELNFVLCCFFWYIAISFKWENALLGEATCVFALMLIMCMMIFTGIEDKKHVRLIIAIIVTILVILFYAYRIFF